MSHSEQLPRTTADMQAELQANDAAANRKWNEWAQPGFESNMAQLAIGATMDKEAAFESLVSPKHAMLEVVTDHTKQVETVDGVRDKRTTSPQKVEAEMVAEKEAKLHAAREKEEALRQPLTNKDIFSATAALGAAIESKAGAGDIAEGQQPEGDLRALSRLSQMVQGQIIDVFGERSEDVKLPLGERLEKMTQKLATDRIIDGKTGAVMFVNYKPSNYYVVSRAKQVYDTLTSADPKIVREGLLDPQSSTSDVLVDAITKPMVVDSLAEVPSEQLLENLNRREHLPTAFWDSSFVGELRNRHSQQAAIVNH